MALPQFGQLFTDGLTEEKLDAVNAEFEMNTLRDLCVSYNNNIDIYDFTNINIQEIQNDRLAMVLSLFERSVPIPESITWGPPYDQGFRKALAEYGYYHRPSNIRHTEIYRVLKNPSKLVDFIATFISLKSKFENEEGLVRNLNNFCQDLKLPEIHTTIEFIKLLPTLKPIDLAYILIIGTFNTRNDPLMFINGQSSLDQYLRIIDPDHHLANRGFGPDHMFYRPFKVDLITGVCMFFIFTVFYLVNKFEFTFNICNNEIFFFVKMK